MAEELNSPNVSTCGRRLLTLMIIILCILQWRKILPESQWLGPNAGSPAGNNEGIFIIAMFTAFRKMFFPNSDPIIAAIFILIICQWISVDNSNLLKNTGLYVIIFNATALFSEEIG